MRDSSGDSHIYAVLHGKHGPTLSCAHCGKIAYLDEVPTILEEMVQGGQLSFSEALNVAVNGDFSERETWSPPPRSSRDQADALDMGD